jgi:putative membrane protein
MMGGFGTGWGGLGPIGLILNLAITIGLLVGLVLLIAWLWRRISTGEQTAVAQRQATVTENSPKEIIQIRYARGEITREQYQQMLADLG